MITIHDTTLLDTLRDLIVAALNGGVGVAAQFQIRTAGGVAIGTADLAFEPAEPYLTDGVRLKVAALPVTVEAALSATMAQFALMDRDGVDILRGPVSAFSPNATALLAGVDVQLNAFAARLAAGSSEVSIASGNLAQAMVDAVVARMEVGTADATPDLVFLTAGATPIETVPLLSPGFQRVGTQFEARGPVSHVLTGAGTVATFQARDRDNAVIFSGAVPDDLTLTERFWTPGRTLSIPAGALTGRFP